MAATEAPSLVIHPLGGAEGRANKTNSLSTTQRGFEITLGRPHQDTEVTQFVFGTNLIESPKIREGKQLRLEGRELKKFIDAVVTQVTSDSVVLSCDLPHAQVDVRLPTNVIPDDLRTYGTPVTLTVREVGGYSQPVIVRREIEDIEKTDVDIEIAAWLHSDSP